MYNDYGSRSRGRSRNNTQRRSRTTRKQRQRTIKGTDALWKPYVPKKSNEIVFHELEVAVYCDALVKFQNFYPNFLFKFFIDGLAPIFTIW